MSEAENRPTEQPNGYKPPVVEHSTEEWQKLLTKKLPHITTSWDLSSMEFPDPEWIVPDIIPEGLTLLAGAPKMGKSWFALNLAVQLSVGGWFLDRKVNRTPVLYIALEDTLRRLHNRLETIEALPDKGFYIATEWFRGSEAIESLEAFHLQHQEVKCIIIDTLGHVKSKLTDSNSYDDTVSEIARIKKFADQYGISVILVHHTRKMQADDYLHTLSGSVGITGTADTVLVLHRTRGEADAILKCTGRDIDESEHALKFDNGKWEMIGDAAEIQSTKERQEIYNLLKIAGEPLKTKQIADELDRSNSSICHTLRKMEEEGTVTSPKYGQWTLCSIHSKCSMSSDKSLHDKDLTDPDGCSMSGTIHSMFNAKPEIEHIEQVERLNTLNTLNVNENTGYIREVV